MPEVQLSWQPGFSLSRKPARRSAPRRSRQQGFEFVAEHPQRIHRKRHSPSINTHGAYSHSKAVESSPSLVSVNKESSIRREGGSPNLGLIDGTIEFHPNSCNGEGQPTVLHSPGLTTDKHDVVGPGPNTTASSTLTNRSYPPFMSVPPAVECVSLTQLYSPILERCMHFVHALVLSNPYY